MKLSDELKEYIDNQLNMYNAYKWQLEQAEQDIIYTNSLVAYQNSINYNINKPTENKALKLIDSPKIEELKYFIDTVDKAIGTLSNIHKKLFEMYYIEKNKDRTQIINKLSISISTYHRYKNDFYLCFFLRS